MVKEMNKSTDYFEQYDKHLINCEIITGVGAGGKVQSSSELVERAMQYETAGDSLEIT